MAEKENPEADGGLLRHLRMLAASGVGYWRTRLKLAGIESKEALRNWLLILVLAVGALALLIFGYLFLTIGLIVIISGWLHIHWEWTTAGFGIFHFIIALICGLILRARFRKPMFEASLAEFRKDQEWLTSTPKPL